MLRDPGSSFVIARRGSSMCARAGGGLLSVIAGLVSVVACCGICNAEAAEWPSPVVPNGFGVNVHFLEAQPGELEMLARAGFRWIRTDFDWTAMERQKGVYDFSRWDRFVSSLEQHHLRAMLVLDYRSPFYDHGASPSSAEGRAAFARWAVAGVRHFRGRGILWEMYNEPNLDYAWTPKADAGQYAGLAVTVGKAIHEAEPNERIVGPALAGLLEGIEEYHYWETCFRSGVLQYWSGVTVHPYREGNPETVSLEYPLLRQLIDQYAPRGRRLPILCGEWGWQWVTNDAAFKGPDEAKQGKMLPRMFLINLMNHAGLTIWYDWHDDGDDPRNKEHHFGVVRGPYHGDQTPVYHPKPACLAAQTLSQQLDGYRFDTRLVIGGPDDYVLQFVKGRQLRWAAWTTGTTPRTAILPIPPAPYGIISHTGGTVSSPAAAVGGLPVPLTDAPVYIAPGPSASR